MLQRLSAFSIISTRPFRHYQRRGLCIDAARMNAGKMDDPEVVRTLELANRALEKCEVCHTDFFTPPVVKECLAGLGKIEGIGTAISGGFAEAERCRISLGPTEILKNTKCSVAGFPGAISALSIEGNFKFDPASHGDFLGSVVGTGISPQKVGDIVLLRENAGAQIVVVPDLIQFLISSITQVRTITVSCKEIPVTDIQTPKVITKKLTTVESSMRIDAVASGGYKLSRSKMADLISKGEVKVNWRAIPKVNTLLKIGDVISISGLGRLQVVNIATTKRGKYVVDILVARS